MDRARLVSGIGLLLLFGGLLLSLVPQYAPGPSQEPFFTGTYWFIGAPLAVAGLALSLWGRSLGRESVRPPQ